MGGGGAAPYSAPVTQNSAEGAPADGAATGRLPSSAPVSQISAEGALVDGLPLDGESPELEASSSESGSAVPVAPQADGDVMAAVVVSGADGADGGESSSSESPTAQRRGRPKKDPVTKAAESAAKKARTKADKDQMKQALSYLTGAAADCMCAAFEKVLPRGGGGTSSAWNAVATEFHALCRTHNSTHPHETISHEHITAEHLKRRWTQLSRETKPTGDGRRSDVLRRVFAANDAVKSIAAYGDADDIVGGDGGFQGVITGPSGDDLPGILEIRSPRPSEESDGRGWRSDSVSCRRKAVAAEATRAPTLSALLAENAATQSANIDRIVDAVNNASNNLVGTLEKLFGGHRGQGAGSGAGSRTE